MPRSKPKASTPEKLGFERQPYFLEGDAPWGGFINIRLDDGQVADFREWEGKNDGDVPAYFDEMLGAGVKASVSFDAAHECYVMAITGALVNASPLRRFCSTSRAGTLSEVMALTVWKHAVLSGGDYGNYKPRDGTFLSFG